MSKSHIYIFNPEADYALAEFKDSYTPPASVVALRRRLAPDQLRYAGPGDRLLLLDLPENRENDTAAIDARCILPRNAKAFFKEISSHPDDFRIRPWNWTPDLIHRLRLWGAPESLLPSEAEVKTIRHLSDRVTTIDFNKKLNRELKKVGLSLHISPLPVKFDDLEQAIEWYRTQGKVFFKYPWSSSGRGILLADGSIGEEKLRQWLTGGIRRQGHVMGETYFKNKKADFATEWEIKNGKAEFLGLSLFHTTADGHYLSNESKPQKELRKLFLDFIPALTFDFIRAQKAALEKTAADYSGFIGIDMMADKKGRIRGGVELNFRMTMGIAEILKNTAAKQRPKVLILGEGNVGSHLANALFFADVDVEVESSRSKDYSLDDVSHVIIAVKDDAVAEVAEKVGAALRLSRMKHQPVVAHTSGSVPVSVLAERLPEGTPYGVFYPMQTFTRGVPMDYSVIPFLLEASDQETFSRLRTLAEEISTTVIEADSEVRSAYHIGAVLTCNFANHLCALASDYLSDQGLDFRILQPLLEQTVAKLRTSTPRDAQTGPAARGDRKVMDFHLDKLKDSPGLAELYRQLSQSITDYTNQKK